MIRYGPARIARALYRRLLRLTPFLEEKIRCDAFPRPQFAYGIYLAARQAKALGYDGFSAIEFGVAGGNGLIAMERIATEIGRSMGLTISVYGFDTGQGMPPAVDYRDAPFIWSAGQFKMDFALLQSRLDHATLVIDDVQAGVQTFLNTMKAAPIGFISFDMDYYSSTTKALAICDAPHQRFLPRPIFYFDDIVGDDDELHCEFIGELLAIREFNDAHAAMKIAQIHGLETKRAYRDHWHVKTFVLHRFDHPRYCEFAGRDQNWQMPLEQV
ncbi:hypothetical protein SAMN05216304_11098 [Bosea sp. OK403]|uniref:hypothetical protein n=1 Tax=Bosea sp. OK403 TaxID=1855286 RepID=UPI0008E4DC3D|nr:hypothetical protein [Bosea sp. OK403]SFJ61453.1 hypothetical protein SAMN05216304_11098 [Bosea sp. OK403]